MQRILPCRPSPSMVVALVALVVALTGTAFAAGLVNGDRLIKKGSLSGNRLRAHTITATQVNLSKLGKVPSARNADTATSAGHATSADTATNANHATTADTATTASGLPPVTFANLTLRNGWTEYSPLSGTASYTKDAQGFVHLQGAVDGSSQTNATFATLPAGFRPTATYIWLRAGATNGSGQPQLVDIQIDAGGDLTVENSTGANDNFVSLEGLTFYAG